VTRTSLSASGVIDPVANVVPTTVLFTSVPNSRWVIVEVVAELPAMSFLATIVAASEAEVPDSRGFIVIEVATPPATAASKPLDGISTGATSGDSVIRLGGSRANP
jgi:hypothetical protein